MSSPVLSSSQFVESMQQRKHELYTVESNGDSESPFTVFYQPILNILQPLQEMNLSPEHYVMVLGGLNVTQWKNLYRHIMVKWSQFYIDQGQLETSSLHNEKYNWVVSWNEIRSLLDYHEVVSKIVVGLTDFTKCTGRDELSLRILFLINSIQNYFIPL